MIRGLVFDIDDTLYDEVDYVRSGFAHVARDAASEDLEARTIEDWLNDAFDSGVRGDTFDRLLDAFPSIASRTTSGQLVEVYRAHAPAIELDSTTAHLLDDLRAGGVLLGGVSDGPEASQRAKVAALGLQRWLEPIVLTASLGPRFTKPATEGFEAVARAWGLAPSALAYVGDNPEKDFGGPRRLGWTTIRLRHDRQLRSALEPADASQRPDVEVSSLAELRDLVAGGVA